MGAENNKVSSLRFGHFWTVVVALARGIVQPCWSGKLLEGIGHGVRKYMVDHKPKPLIAVVFSDAAIFQISRLFWRHVCGDSFCAGWSSMPPFLSVSGCIGKLSFRAVDSIFYQPLLAISLLYPPCSPPPKIACSAMTGTLFRPVQVLYDANFAFCFFLFCPRSLARMGYAAFISLVCLLVPLILNIVDHWMWLDANNGNANYMFFQCLAYNVFLGVVLGQFVSASMQRDKALRLAKERIEIKS